jgi:hypothetical protein
MRDCGIDSLDFDETAKCLALRSRRHKCVERLAGLPIAALLD